MRALVRAREQTDESDDEPDPRRYQPKPRQVLRMRCYACAGTGKLEVIDDPSRRVGRIVRCIACRGTGQVVVK